LLFIIIQTKNKLDRLRNEKKNIFSRFLAVFFLTESPNKQIICFVFYKNIYNILCTLAMWLFLYIWNDHPCLMPDCPSAMQKSKSHASRIYWNSLTLYNNNNKKQSQDAICHYNSQSHNFIN